MAKKKTKVKARPGAEGRVELGERLIVDPSPYSTGKKIAVTVNVRESAIDHMRSRGRIDATQAAAGDWFRKVWELAAIGRQKGLDYADAGRGVGGVGDPLTDETVRAGRELSRIVRALGPVRGQILINVVGEGRRIEDVARDWSKAGGIVKGARAEGYVTGTLVDALDDLIRLRRMEGVGAPVRRPATYLRAGRAVAVNDSIRASGPMSCSGPATEIYVADDGAMTVENFKPLDRTPLMHHTSGNLGSSARDARRKNPPG